MKRTTASSVCHDLSHRQQHEEQTNRRNPRWQWKRRRRLRWVFASPPPPPATPVQGLGSGAATRKRPADLPRTPVPDAAIGDDDEESSSVGERGLRGAEGMKHALDPVPGGGGHWPIATQGTPRPLRGSPSGLQACIHLVLLLLGSGTAGVALLAGPDSVCDEVAVFERWGPFWVRLVDFCVFNLLFLYLREGR